MIRSWEIRPSAPPGQPVSAEQPPVMRFYSQQKALAAYESMLATHSDQVTLIEVPGLPLGWVYAAALVLAVGIVLTWVVALLWLLR